MAYKFKTPKVSIMIRIPNQAVRMLQWDANFTGRFGLERFLEMFKVVQVPEKKEKPVAKPKKKKTKKS